MKLVTDDGRVIVQGPVVSAGSSPLYTPDGSLLVGNQLTVTFNLYDPGAKEKAIAAGLLVETAPVADVPLVVAGG